MEECESLHEHHTGFKGEDYFEMLSFVLLFTHRCVACQKGRRDTCEERRGEWRGGGWEEEEKEK
jgi:hypothetical protein